MNYIIYSDGNFEIYNDGQKALLESRPIRHYKDTCEQLKRSHDWKSETDHIFSDNFMIPEETACFEPKVRGITSNGGECFYYALELENGGGIYKKNRLYSDEEGFVYTSRNAVPQHPHSQGNRLVCSIQLPDQTKHIVMFVSDCPDYYELTAGESVDEHPFIYGGYVYFTTSGIHRNEDGSVVLGNKCIARYDIENNEVTELFSSEKYDLMMPRIDDSGNLYFIKRPINKASESNVLIDIITAPFWIFAAIVGFICTFTRIFSGKQLLGKNNSVAAHETAQEIIDGCNIDISREEKRNARSKEPYPSYAPKSWELVRIDGGANITSADVACNALKKAHCIRRGVIGYELLDDGTFVISNGNCLIHCSSDSAKLITKARAINQNFTVNNL